MQADKKPSPDAMQKALQVMIDAVGLPPSEAKDYLQSLACVSIHFIRATQGDEFARGFLEGALSDLNGPPMIEIRRLQ